MAGAGATDSWILVATSRDQIVQHTMRESTPEMDSSASSWIYINPTLHTRRPTGHKEL